MTHDLQTDIIAMRQSDSLYEPYTFRDSQHGVAFQKVFLF